MWYTGKSTKITKAVGILLAVLLILTLFIKLMINIKNANEMSKAIVEQYCHVVHRFSVDEYLTCKDNDAETLLINITNEAGEVLGIPSTIPEMK